MSLTSNYVIFDCNGSSDDAWALALLLKADSIGKIKLLAITCVPGPIRREIVARNMREILRKKGRNDIPIYLGAHTRFMPYHYDTDCHHDHHDHHSQHGNHGQHCNHGQHGNNGQHCNHGQHGNHGHHCNHNHYGMHHHHHGKDAFDEIFPEDFLGERDIEDKHAVKAIRDLVYQYPNQVTIISTGPLTNIALTLAMYGSEYAPLIKALFIMGGAYQAVGNITRDAEFNFHLDPEAAQIVMAMAKCPITIIPWEACLKDRFHISANWRFDVLGANKQDDFIALMNKLERGLIGSTRHVDWIPYDALIVAVFLFGIHFVSAQSQWNVQVELFGKYTRGEMILDHLKNLLINPINATVIEHVDANMFKMIALWAAGYSGANSDYIQGLL